MQVGCVARLAVDLATSVLRFDVKQHEIVKFNVNYRSCCTVHFIESL